MKKYVDYSSRGLCILLASALLVLSPVSSYISAGNMQTVEAAEIAAAGGSYLFEFLLALFGVSMAGVSDIQKENAYGGYLRWVETGGDAEVYEAITGYQTGDSVELTGSMVGSVSDYLKSVNANIISGTAGTVTVPGDVYMGSNYANSYADVAFRSVPLSINYTHCFYMTLEHGNSYDYCAVYAYNSSDPYVYLVVNPIGTIQLYSFNGSGAFVTASSSAFKERYIYNPISGTFTLLSNGTYGFISDISKVYTTIPVLQVTDPSFDSYKNLNLLLANSICLNGENTSPKYLVTGNYSSRNVEAITGQTVSGSTITAVNSAVADAVGANTTTDEDGATIYADAIGQAVAQAVQKALEESGFKVIEGGGGTETDPGGEENADPLPFVPQIIEKIEEVGGAIKSGFNNVIDKITTTGEEIKNGIVEQIQSVLESLFVPDISAVQESVDLITSKFEWVQDLYNLFKTTLTSFNADCRPPIIYIDFTNSETSSFVNVGRIVALDLSWYARYKATGDLLIGSFLWIFYLWRLFKKIPDVINGQGMSVESEG